MRKSIFHLSICLFFISLEYSITRPCSCSIFIHNYGASFLPVVWLATIPINLFVTYLYNYFLPKFGNLRIFFIVVFLSLGINLLSFFYIENLYFLSFIQFLWKDIYILLMYQQVWSLINSHVEWKKAKFLYGIIFGMGGIGGIVGGMVPGFFAISFGSSFLFLFTPFIYTIILFFYILANKVLDDRDFSINQKIKNFSKNNPFTMLRKSKYLICILFLVLFMQVSTTIIDYQFNIFLEKTIPLTDQRTAYIGKLISIIHIATTFLQGVGSVVMIRFLGIKSSHFFIPLALITNFLVFLIRPTFFMISYLFVFIKSMDFSLFNILKEMLFLPIGMDEKFRVKAIIDVFSYRSAKGITSIFLILFQFMNVSYLTSYVLIVLGVFWVFVLISLFKQETSKELV